MDEAPVQTAPGAGPPPQAQARPYQPYPNSVPATPAVGAPVPSVAPEQPEKATPFGPSEGVPSVSGPLPNFQKRWQSGESGSGLTPRPSAWDSFVSSAQKGIHDTGLGLLYRLGQESAQPEGQQLSPANANKLYPGRPVPYTTPVNENIARLEYNDRVKQEQLDEWVARGNHGAASWTGNLVGSLTDPMALALGAITGGVAEVALPATAPFITRAAAHFMGNWAGFAQTEALENWTQYSMGAKQKQIGQIAGESLVPAATMSVIGMGLGAIARKFLNETGGAVDPAFVRKSVAAMEMDQRMPTMDQERATMAARKAGASQVMPGQTQLPTVLTSPIHEAKLYGAAHADGSPLIHEHGMGPGRQFTDSYDVANNGVSRSSDVPGQLGETRLPEKSNLLDLTQSASDQKEFVKAIEEKTGMTFDKNAPLKEILTEVSDAAGTSKEVPEDIMQKIQEIAKAQGYDGYQFKGTTPEGQVTNRQVHLFDATGMSIENQYHADPSTTPQIQTSPSVPPEIPGSQPAEMGNPGAEKVNRASYSPEIEQLVHDFRKKNQIFDPHGEDSLAAIEKDTENYKQQLTDLSETSPSAGEALDQLKKQEVQDARLRDMAKRIAECGSGGGL